jgi:hypothetical protein
MRYDFSYNQSIAGCHTYTMCSVRSKMPLDLSVPLIEIPKTYL